MIRHCLVRNLIAKLERVDGDLPIEIQLQDEIWYMLDDVEVTTVSYGNPSSRTYAIIRMDIDLNKLKGGK